MEFCNENYGIYDVTSQMDRDRFSIRWKWPDGIDIVYILQADILNESPMENISERNVKLYTKEEYREFNGYVKTIKEIGQYKFIIFPAIQENEDIILLKQDNGINEIIISTGKPEISYEIEEIKNFKSLFSREKTIEIIINSEVALNKDVLCYVKKQGSYPVSKEDGICFDFIDNIHAGINIMPDINIGKDEYIRVFIKDIDKYGNAYSLKQE